MKSQRILISLALTIVVCAIITGYILMPAPVADRPIRLVFAGPDGQHFSGSYIANGITNSISAITPTTIEAQAKEFRYEFRPGDAREEFRVKLEVGDVLRTSFVSYQGKSVRGGYSYTRNSDTVW